MRLAMEGMDKNKFKQLMDGYIRGDLSADELALLERWYASFGESAIGVPGMDDDQATQAIKDELDSRIRQEIMSENTVYKKRVTVSWKWLAVAAFWVGLVSGVVWLSLYRVYKPKALDTLTEQVVFREVKTGLREIKKVSLPDGSKLYLNAHSVVRIPVNVSRNIREVFLDEGEAYFEVAQDSHRPFVVQMQKLSVEVLGTAFNVRSYQSLEDVRVAVKQGKVRVSDTTHVLGELVADEGLTYRTADGKATKNNRKGTAIDAWIRGSVNLEKASFQELAVALYNLYGIRLKSTHPQTETYHYNVHLHADRSLAETMDIICDIHNTRYRRTGNEITIYP
ncbi:FecR domain-containing protein [Olivibacter sp. SDN3]|uniref:FecR family protein n=1 Tax=Olivibacter sp. SDN3 TaxID=2764720 RepID=UPI001651113C|nr:FecR family protein [Olivibacter sp. SDN3]QNL52006.1 FecR domain-containing protein [Olivibacter sp. SDN3]